MKRFKFYLVSSLIIISMSCNMKQNKLTVDVYETSANGNKLKRITEFPSGGEAVSVLLLPDNKFQTITGLEGRLRRRLLIC